jgi:outer membrane protein
MLRSGISAASVAAFLYLSASGARGAESDIAFPFSPGSSWVVTLGGYGGASPSFPGSATYVPAVRPILDIYRAGDRTWLSLPTDAYSFNLYSGGDFRFGVAADYIFGRHHGDDSALHGLRNIDLTFEGGAFAEYYPFPFLRTRAEILQGVSGADGLQANLIADYILTPDPSWLFTVGPRLQIVNTKYNSAFFSINGAESLASGLPPYHATGGLESAGIDASVRYYLSECLSLRAFGEWDRLLGDAAGSPLVKLRGSENQFEFGLGAAYRFTYTP